ncbi:tetratricopeptide repeat protein [Candidatus Cloacimonadota bacterium]
MNKKIVVLFVLSLFFFVAVWSITDPVVVLEQYRSSELEGKKKVISELDNNSGEYELEDFNELIEQLLTITEEPFLKGKLYNLIGDRFEGNENLASAISNYLKAIQAVHNEQDSDVSAYAYFSLGQIYSDLNEQNKSLEYLERAELIYDKLGDHETQANVLNNMGIVYQNLNIYDEALIFYFKALMIYEDIDDKEGIANAYVNIGNINQGASHFNEALEYYTRAFDLYKEMNDDVGISDCLNNIGIVYDDLNEHNKALSYYLESKKYSIRLEDEAGIATTQNNLGYVYKQLGDFSRALENYTQSLEISIKLKDTWSIANTNVNIGELYIDYEDYFHGLEFLNRGMAISEENNFADLLIDGYNILAKYYKNIHDYENALYYYQNYVTLKDSIIIASSKRIGEIQSIYQSQKHAKEIELLEVKQKLGNNIRIILYSASAGLLIIIIWLFILYKNKNKEIYKRRKLEKNILRLAHIVNQAEESIIMTELDGKIIYANSFVEKSTGYSSEELIGNNPSIFKSGFMEDQTYQDLWNTINSGQVWKGVFFNKRKNGDLYFEDAVIFPIKDEDGKLINFAAVKKDITEQITAQNDLKASEFRFRTMAKKINDGLMIVENEKIVYVNDEFENITGYDLKKLQNIKMEDIILDDDLNKAYKLLEDVTKNLSENKDIVLWIKPLTGEKRYVLCGLTHHKIDNKNSAYYLVITDITNRKLSEDKLRQSLTEKEVLIKEIHHRVKNNMQVVSSLLQLQSRYIKDPETLEIFKKSQNRVRSMSLIHEKLYRADDLAHIDFNDYIRKLSRHLLIVYSVDTNKVQIEYDTSEIYLDIVQAIPVGLILNELISNCLKYAFVEMEKGNIKISMHIEDGFYHLSIIDNGVGIPADHDPKKSESLGLQLVNSLSEQLHGKLEVLVQNGTRFSLIFPEVNKKDK